MEIINDNGLYIYHGREHIPITRILTGHIKIGDGWTRVKIQTLREDVPNGPASFKGVIQTEKFYAVSKRESVHLDYTTKDIKEIWKYTTMATRTPGSSKA